MLFWFGGLETTSGIIKAVIVSRSERNLVQLETLGVVPVLRADTP